MDIASVGGDLPVRATNTLQYKIEFIQKEIRRDPVSSSLDSSLRHRNAIDLPVDFDFCTVLCFLFSSLFARLRNSFVHIPNLATRSPGIGPKGGNKFPA